MENFVCTPLKTQKYVEVYARVWYWIACVVRKGEGERRCLRREGKRECG